MMHRPATDNGSRMAALLTIGEVSRRSGFTVKALRFYDARGLLPPAGRSAGGYRLYDAEDLHRLAFIRRAKALGLDLDQIREIVRSTREPRHGATRVRLRSLLAERIRDTARQIEALTRLKAELSEHRRALGRPRAVAGAGRCSCLEPRGTAACETARRASTRPEPRRPNRPGAPLTSREAGPPRQ